MKLSQNEMSIFNKLFPIILHSTNSRYSKKPSGISNIASLKSMRQLGIAK
jgi:hypothetical protein